MIILDIARIITIMIDIEIMIDTEVTADIIHKTIIELILDKDTTIDLKVHIHPDLDTTTTIKEELHPDPHIDYHTEALLIIDIILDQDIDLVLNHKEIPSDYIYPYRTPSKPRDYRSRCRTPSQNRQQNKINQINVKSFYDKDSTKFEVHTCQIIEIANTITPYSWFYPLYIHALERKDNTLPSILEIVFLLNTGASISVLNPPTFHVIAKQLNLHVPKGNENTRAKTLLVANQTEVPIVHYVSMTSFTEVNHQNRSFNIEFAVANIKYNILGAPFFKKNIQNICS